MTDPSKRRSEAEDYGFARVRDMAYDAVLKLWRQRRGEGLSQKDIADKLGRDQGWVSRQLSGPGNWTLRTFGAFVEALDGEAVIEVVPSETVEDRSNFDAYWAATPAAALGSRHLFPVISQSAPSARMLPLNASMAQGIAA